MISPEEEEFLEAERQHQAVKESLGKEEWERWYYTRSYHFGVLGQNDTIELMVRDLSTLPPSVAGHGLGGSGGGGSMSYSGLHTWGSAVALAQLLLHDSTLVDGKSVLELGSGTGLPSLAASRWARSVVASDSSEELLANVVHNAKLNTATLHGCDSKITTAIIRWEEPWGLGSFGSPRRDGRGDLVASFDVVVGAELLHEVGKMPDLAKTVKCALGRGGAFYGVSPRGARRDAIDAFVASWDGSMGEQVQEEAFPVGIMRGNGDEWNFGSCEGDALVLITIKVPRPGQEGI